MKLRYFIIFVAILSLSSISESTREILTISERLSNADIVVIGTLTEVRNCFTVEFDDPMIDSFGLDRWIFKCGDIVIDEVITSNKPMGEKIRISFRSSVEKDGAHKSDLFPSSRIFYEGDRGIWILRRGTHYGYYGLAGHDCLLPVGEKPTIVEALKSEMEKD